MRLYACNSVNLFLQGLLLMHLSEVMTPPLMAFGLGHIPCKGQLLRYIRRNLEVRPEGEGQGEPVDLHPKAQARPSCIRLALSFPLHEIEQY